MKRLKVEDRYDEHKALIEILAHNVDGLVNVTSQAKQDHGERIAHYFADAEKLKKRLDDYKLEVKKLFDSVVNALKEEYSGQDFDMEGFKKNCVTLNEKFDAIMEIDAEVHRIAGALQAEPLLANSLTATYSLPEGMTQVPKGVKVNLGLALSARKKITMTNPEEIIDFVSQKASSVPVKKIQMHFGMSIIDAVTKGRNIPIAVASTLTPGKARLAGAPGLSFGYLWEFSVIPAKSTNPADMITGTCFMSVNDRDLFSKVYSDQPGTDADKMYSGFVPDEEMGTNLH